MISARVANKLKSKLVQGVAGAFGLRLVYTGLTFLTVLLLARVLGRDGYGAYTSAVTWAYLLSVPATMGFDNFVVREISVYQDQSLWGLMRGLLRWANKAVLAVSGLLALVAVLVVWGLMLAGSLQSEKFMGLSLALMLMPALSLRNIRRGAMRGLDQITKGLLPELLIDPLILVTLTVCAYAILRENLNPLWVIGFYGLGTSITLVILSRFLHQSLPANAKTAQPEYKGMTWIKQALPFVLIESIPIINGQTDILMLGAFKGDGAVGLYSPVNRGAQLITFILMAVGSALAPKIASAYADSRLMDLQRTITKSVRIVASVAFLFAMSLIVCGRWYLSLYGPEYVEGERALHILCISGFVSTSTGLAFMLLNMTGYERFTGKVGWLTTVLNIVLNAIFIPLWGVIGAAIATSSSTMIGGFITLWAVRRWLGIDATLMGLPAKNPVKR